jgi:5-methylcytosine-specific restriction endonuclease McrA
MSRNSANGSIRRWRKVTDALLKRQPACAVCGAPAIQIDHIKPLRDGGRRYDSANLRPM